jgi:hypothetical protein
MKNISTDEKIDYIYKSLKKQNRNSNIKMIIRLIIIAAIGYYMYVIYNYGYQNLLQDLLDLILPAVQDSVQ